MVAIASTLRHCDMEDDEVVWDPFADPALQAAQDASLNKSSSPTHSETRIVLDALPDFFAEELELLEAAYATQLLESAPEGHKQWFQNSDTVAETFANSIAEANQVSQEVNNNGTDVESAYEGPVYQKGNVTLEFCKDLVQWQKNQRNLSKSHAYSIVLDMIELLKNLSTVVDVDVAAGAEITVCGDIHGQYYDLLNIFEINGVPSEDNPYLFNGDLVDRGSFSCEVILALFSWKLLYPQHLHIARGNHESRALNRIYGFEGEVRAKYDVGLYSLFCEAFCLLPLCHVINSQIFVVHGGLFSQDDVTLDDIRKIDRNTEPPDEGLMVEMLWSDPQPARGRACSKRGVGVAFGSDVTENFLKTNDLKLVIRSHEVCEEGCAKEHDGQLITVFSAPNYCDIMGNKGAFIRLDGETMTPSPHSFVAVPHPAVRAMQYAGMGMIMGMN